MGNTATSAGSNTKRVPVDNLLPLRDSCSPRPDDSKSFEFTAGSKKKGLFTNQPSVDFVNQEEAYKTGGRRRSATVSQGSRPQPLSTESSLPTVFKWEGGGKEVYITGTFSEWKPIKMCHSHGDFVAIVDVPEGMHEYKFIVDGNETVSSNSKVHEQTSNNVINVNKGDFEVFEALAMDLASNTNNSNSSNSTSFNCGSPPGPYAQILPSNMRTRSESGGSSHGATHSSGHGSGPPILPPHLLQVILNNPTAQGTDATLLPQPNHVMLNHLYALSIKDGVMVLSTTHRYRKKYVTTLLYKPI